MSESSAMTFVLPVVTATIALAVGAGMGAAAVYNFRAPERVEVPVTVVRELTSEELTAACQPLVDAVKTEAQKVEEKVVTLEGQVQAKQAEVQKLERDLAKRTDKAEDLSAKLAAAKAELATLQQALTVALEEKAELQVQLDDTTRRLDDQVVQTRVAKDETVAQKWASFQQQAQLTICEKGNRKVLDKCRETVAAKVRPFESKFLACLRSGQAAPSVRISAKREELPAFAEYLDQADRVTKDWYVLLCDPSLPEARELPGNAAAE